VVATAEKIKAKPFLKWAGGKGQLLDEIDKRLPKEDFISGRIDTYIEPFVGGGAVFFHVVQQYPQIKNFYLFDINEDLVNCYNAVKNNANSLIKHLNKIHNNYLSKTESQRKDYYYRLRDEFNNDRDPAKLVFLNKTCYNGLYRVNQNGQFNVPFGGYDNPTICDKKNLLSVSQVLKNVVIIYGDFEDSEQYVDENTLVYFDPPYRPLTRTASFTSYSKEDFNEESQIRLTKYCRRINEKGAKFLLSNSCPKDNFFCRVYRSFTINKVRASRAINCKGNSRGEIDELIITNYRRV
jgi:DNA adenine methylase